MVKKLNLADKIEQSLPEELVGLIKKAVDIASVRKQPFYLVGGIVRDLLLGQGNLDLDLVVEGEAIAIAKQFAEKTGGKLTPHPMFNTARITLGERHIDVAMARTETYAKPGALPTVKPGTIKTDLFRRDFTVNAMAVYLTPDRYGELIDLYGGRDDLKNKLIRVLHDKSFSDDATRILRAIRYEQRLGFKIEPETLKLLKRDLPMLKRVGEYRLKRELGLVLKEKNPEKALSRTEKLGVLKELCLVLKTDARLTKKLQGRI
ncbi:MAG: CCA tRNA nucleotidyltransferase [Dehalococcoidales bacterium]|nr:CCA tRNA nucleotidyltransferase [Dehalococcoidales bacterium]